MKGYIVLLGHLKDKVCFFSFFFHPTPYHVYLRKFSLMNIICFHSTYPHPLSNFCWERRRVYLEFKKKAITYLFLNVSRTLCQCENIYSLKKSKTVSYSCLLKRFSHMAHFFIQSSVTFTPKSSFSSNLKPQQIKSLFYSPDILILK